MKPRLRSIVFTVVAVISLWIAPALGIVDMKNMNFGEEWVDLTIDSVPFRWQRFYNSRSNYDGILGFGWCTPYESTLEVVSEQELRYVYCGGAMSSNLIREQAGPGEEKLVRFSSPRLLGLSFSPLRAEWDGSYYTVIDGGFSKNPGLWTFDGKGQLVSIYVPARSSVDGKNQLPASLQKLFYKDGALVRLVIDDKTSIRFFYWENGKVQKIVVEDPRVSVKFSDSEPSVAQTSNTGMDDTVRSAEYSYDANGNLAAVRNAWGNRYSYRSDGQHHLKRIDFPDGTYKELEYDTEHDWVVSFRNRKGCIEQYIPQVEKTVHRVWVEKRCKDEVTNQSLFEFTFPEQQQDPTQPVPSLIREWINEEMHKKVYHDDGRLLRIEPAFDPLPPHPHPNWKALFWPPKGEKQTSNPDMVEEPSSTPNQSSDEK